MALHLLEQDLERLLLHGASKGPAAKEIAVPPRTIDETLTVAQPLLPRPPDAEVVAGRNPYFRPWPLVAVGIACLVVAALTAVILSRQLQGTAPDNCIGGPRLDITPGTTTRIAVNWTGGGVPPISTFQARLSVDGTPVATLAPLADGASSGPLTFHDATRPDVLSDGDFFTVSPVTPGEYRLALYTQGCDLIFAGATWFA